MMDTYRVRHAVRDVGAALGMPPGEVDAIAKAFPHIRARDARLALRDLPELRASGLGDGALDHFFGLVERLDGLPRHIAVHPCGVLLSDATLLDRTPGRGVVGRLPDEPVRQGRRRGARPAQARRARHPDAVGDGPRGRRGRAGRRRQDRPRRRGAGALRRRHDLRDDQRGQDARRLPDRVARPARARRQVRHRDLRRHHHRHLAVPARAGQERHDHPLPRGQAGLEDRPLPPRRPAPDPRADPRRGGLPRAGDRDDRARSAGSPTPRATRSAAPSATPRGWPRPRRGSSRARWPQGYDLAAGRAGLEGARGLRLVRLLQGARRRVRPADLPVGLAQGALAGALPVRRAHPRPRDVPQAADPRRRPPVRGRGARARRQRERVDLRRRAGRAPTRATRSGSRSPT